MLKKFKPYMIGAVAGVFVTAAVLGAAYVAYKKVKPIMGKITAKLSDMKYNNIKRAAEEFVIADFEKPDDFRKFSDSNAVVELSKEFPSQGTYCAKVTFKKSKAPSFRIEKYFERDKSFANWAPYGSFLFDIYNPQDSPQRLILQIKDTRGNKIKRDIRLEANAKETIEVEIPLLRRHLSIYRIAQISLFMWEPKTDHVFYVDNLRLVPQGRVIRKSIFDEEFARNKEAPYALGDYFVFPASRWTAEDGKIRFPLRIVNPHGMRVGDFPCRGGVPFPRGELKSKDEIAVFDAAGKAVVFQARAMARWDDGSIKWLLLDLSATADPGGLSTYFVSYPVVTAAKKIEPLVAVNGASVVVDTGKVKFQLSGGHFRLFDKLWMYGKEIVSHGGDMVVRFRGREYLSSLDKESQVTIEENGPLVATIKAEGWFVSSRKQKFCKYVVRLRVYKNESFVRIFHTLIYTGYPENKHHYLYKGMRLPGNETIEEIALDFRIPEVLKGGVLSFAADAKVMQASEFEKPLTLLQEKDDLYRVWKDRKEKIGEGRRMEGWMDVSGANGTGVTVVVRKLWQQYPKALEVDPSAKTLRVKLWPREAGDLDLKTTQKAEGPEAVARGSAFGLAKTHELILYFHEGDYKKADARALALVSQEPPLILASPDWMSDTRALGALADYFKGSRYFQRYEDSLEKLFDWAARQKKDFKWYGMLDFGDTLSWHRSESYLDESYDEAGWHPVGRWGWFNCEGAGTHMGALLQFARSGNYKYFVFGEDLARHIMDIDTCHYNTVREDRRLRRLYQDYSRPGSMHRHNGDHWGGRNDSADHTNVNGILLYYYLTGNERALDVAREIGEFFLGRHITYFKHPDVAPHRGMANILWGEIALYETTGDERLKKDADYWADVFFQGQNRNGSFNENYNPQGRRWEGDPHSGYMSGYTLPALIAYHQYTRNPAIKETIVKLSAYLAKHDGYAPIFNGLAYSYFLTGEKVFLDEIGRRLDRMVSSQRDNDNPVMNGMIYQKPYYARVVDFLLFTPYAFDALLSRQDAVEE